MRWMMERESATQPEPHPTLMHRVTEQVGMLPKSSSNRPTTALACCKPHPSSMKGQMFLMPM